MLKFDFLCSRFFVKKYWINLLFVAFLLFLSCAKVVPPGGGEIDRTPPKLLKVSPDSGLVNFQFKEIVFSFDEYFVLKNPNTNIFFSPLLDDDIDYRIKNKNLIIKVPNSLKENQTYNLIFNNTIADYNEGNVLPLLKYNFSTGSEFDSLKLNSRVIDASKLSGVEKVQMYLIPYPADSALLKKQFAHFTNSVAGGSFEFANLSAGKYLLFALEEKSLTHTISSIENRIGFSQDPIYIEKNIINDSTYSIITTLDYPILLFQEKDTIMKIVKSQRVRKGLHEIVLNNEPESVQVNLLNNNETDSMLVVPSKNKDSLSIWFINQSSDVVSLEIKVNQEVLDTLSVSLRQIGRGASQSDSIAVPKLSLYSMIESSKIRKNDNLRLWLSNPASIINNDSVLIISKNDTIIPTVFINQNFPNIIELGFEKQEEVDYEIVFKKESITDCFNIKLDSTRLRFSVLSEQYFGSIKLLVSETEIPECYVFELINSSGTLYKSFAYNKSMSEFLWEELLPGDYTLRIVIDDNCNGQWDTGIFAKRKQPEQIIKSEFKITVKSNWTNETVWSIDL